MKVLVVEDSSSMRAYLTTIIEGGEARPLRADAQRNRDRVLEAARAADASLARGETSGPQLLRAHDADSAGAAVLHARPAGAR